MDACIDIGNTSVKIGLFWEEGHLVSHYRFEKADTLSIKKAYAKHTDIKRTIIAGSGDVTPFVEEIPKDHQPFLFQSIDQAPLSIEYDTPGTLGKDRIASVLGAYSLFPDKDLLVVDAGTCITYDFISKNKVFKGGSIHPGVTLRYKSMHDYTDKLPLLKPELVDNFDLLGKTTAQCMHVGVTSAIIHEMNGFIGWYLSQYPNLKIIITGGDSQYFVGKLNYEIFAHSNLVLLGLHQILQSNA